MNLKEPEALPVAEPVAEKNEEHIVPQKDSAREQLLSLLALKPFDPIVSEEEKDQKLILPYHGIWAQTSRGLKKKPNEDGFALIDSGILVGDGISRSLKGGYFNRRILEKLAQLMTNPETKSLSLAEIATRLHKDICSDRSLWYGGSTLALAREYEDSSESGVEIGICGDTVATILTGSGDLLAAPKNHGFMHKFLNVFETHRNASNRRKVVENFLRKLDEAHKPWTRLVDKGDWPRLSKLLWEYFDAYGAEGVEFNVAFAGLDQYVAPELETQLLTTKIPYPPDGQLIVLLQSDGLSNMVTTGEAKELIQEEGFELGLEYMFQLALERGKMTDEGLRPMLTMSNGKTMEAHALYPDHITLVGKKFSIDPKAGA